jgi:hypothetical protein
VSGPGAGRGLDDEEYRLCVEMCIEEFGINMRKECKEDCKKLVEAD